MTGLAPPTVPDALLEGGGWELVDERVEPLLEKSQVQVAGATRRYEDARSRRALRDATTAGVDHPIRFFAVTRLEIDSSFPFGVPLTLFRSKIRREVRESFVERLESQGLVDVEREGRDRLRLPYRTRIRLDRYSAVDPIDLPPGEGTDQIELPLECGVGLWIDGGTLRVLSGGYPAVELATAFDLEVTAESLTRSPAAYREEFEALLGGVVRAVIAA